LASVPAIAKRAVFAEVKCEEKKQRTYDHSEDAIIQDPSADAPFARIRIPRMQKPKPNPIRFKAIAVFSNRLCQFICLASFILIDRSAI
jgi:hypothetical protein